MKQKGLLALVLMLCFSVSWGQTRQISGRVTKINSNEAVPGVTVAVKGTNTQTSTDNTGNYKINVPEQGNVRLVFSSIGFATREVAVGSGAVLDVSLTEQVSTLNDVVVIGYGTARKKDVTGAISSISGAQLEKVPVSSAAEAITGRIPGVQVTTTDGAPGAEIVIRIRGGGSITQDNSPLYIVDGFQVSSINDIPPADIASVDVLKDASAGAIYGARGANGVIIITTKTAKSGKTTINYNGYTQLRTLPRKLDVLSPYEYVLAQYEYARIRSQSEVDAFSKYFGVYDDLELYRNQEGTDWQDKLFGQPVWSQQHNVSLTAGTDKTKVSLSVTNNKDEGLMPGSGYQRNYLNFKLNHEIAKPLKFDFGTRFTHTVIDGAGTSGSSSVRIGDGITTRPVNGIADQIVIDPATIGSGDEYEQFLRNLVNPVRLSQQDYRKRTTKSLNLNTGISWAIIKNLTLRSDFGYDMSFGTTKRYYGPLTSESKNVGGNLPLGEITRSEAFVYRWSNTLNYLWKKNDRNDFNFLLGQEITASGLGNSQYARSKYFAENMQPEDIFANFGLGTVEQSTTTVPTPEKIASFFGRAIWNFDDRFIVNFTARADGSSNFAPGHQWGIFPSASAKWRLSQEKFMDNVDFVSDLGLRISYGEAGNNRIGTNLFRPVKQLSTNRTYGAGDLLIPYWTNPSVLYDENLKWETTVTRNAGLDFGLWKNRVSGSLDVYFNTTKDLLITTPIPQYTGYSFQQKNIGQTSNHGIELGLNASLINKKNFTLSGTFNFGINRAKIDKLAGNITEMPINSNWAGTDLKQQDDYRLYLNQTIGLMYGHVTDGFYTSADFSSYNPVTRVYTLKPGVVNVGAYMGGISLRPGVLKLKDMPTIDTTGDGIPDVGDGIINAADRTVIGSAQPKHTGGFGFNATMKAFDLGVFFNWVYGNDVYNTGRISFNMLYRTTYGNMLNTMNSGNRYKYIDANGNQVTDLDELDKLNANATMWSPFSMGNASPVIHSYAVEDGSFLRLNTLTLGYSLPKSLISRVKMNRLRVYATVYNLFTWTNYSGYDPEVSASRNSGYNQLAPGVDFSAYPKSRTYTAGVNVTF
jgi:TonB-dependent starch-binding outer membrane protein SusC